MKLRTFKAASMPLALAEVKRELGPEAVIVRTRSFKQGGLFGLRARSMVEITAYPPALAPPVTQSHSRGARRVRRAYNSNTRVAPDRSGDGNPRDLVPAMPKELTAQIGNIQDIVEKLVMEQRRLHAPQMPEQLFDLYLDLIQREVAEELARELIQRVEEQMVGDQNQSADIVRGRLVDVMDGMLNAAGPICANLSDRARVVALVGPTGVGKTTTIAKLAANFKLRQNKKVGLITIDTYRIGAVDQLRTYAQIIDVPLDVVVTPSDLTRAIELMKDMDIVLIDTAGRSQTDHLKIRELQTFLDAAKPDEVHLVLSSTAHHSHMLSAAEEFSKLGVDRVILTKLDEAISFGVVLSVLRSVDASLSYITTGQDVPDDIEVGSGRQLAQKLLGLEPINATKSAIPDKIYA